MIEVGLECSPSSLLMQIERVGMMDNPWEGKYRWRQRAQPEQIPGGGRGHVCSRHGRRPVCGEQRARAGGWGWVVQVGGAGSAGHRDAPPSQVPGSGGLR